LKLDIILIILICVGCQSNQKEISMHNISEDNKIFLTSGIISNDKNDYSKINPIVFISILKDKSDSIYLDILTQPPKGWIKDGHIHELIKLIDSQEPAANVCDMKSPHVPSTQSTVGMEAMLLIDAFRTGKYHGTCSDLAKYQVNPEEIKNWYKNWRK